MRNLVQTMPKNAYFSEKRCKIATESRLHPQTPVGLWGLRPPCCYYRIITLFRSFLTLTAFFSHLKKNGITTVNVLLLLLLHLFFTSNFVTYLNISYPRAQVTLATPLVAEQGEGK